MFKEIVIKSIPFESMESSFYIMYINIKYTVNDIVEMFGVEMLSEFIYTCYIYFGCCTV